MNSKTARCAGSLKDGSPCRSVVVRDENGELSAYCSHHLKLAQASPASPVAGEVFSEAAAVTQRAVVSEDPEPEGRESAPISSIRAALKGDLSTSTVADSIAELLLEGLRASKDVYATCAHCRKRTPVSLPDLGTRIGAARALMEELEGKLAQQAKSSEDRISEALAGKTKLEDLSNEELLVLASGLEERASEDDWLRAEVVAAARRIVDAADGLALAGERA